MGRGDQTLLSGNLESEALFAGWSGLIAHPNSPSGGGGLGVGRIQGPLGCGRAEPAQVAHPQSPRGSAIGYVAETGNVSPERAFQQRLLQPGESIRGNLFFGGAGIDGAYIDDMVSAFATKGIALTPVNREKWSGGTLLDAALGVDIFRQRSKPAILIHLDNFLQSGPQFNLIGYSYGSLLAAHVAINYAEAGTRVDNLVLIGSPIADSFLSELQSAANIKKVLIVNLSEQGDPLRAGMTRLEIAASVPTLVKQMHESSGHFHYAPSTPEGRARRDALAAYLYSKGIR
jgi:hypothetical protein